MNYDSVVDRGDFFSPHYLSAVVDKDLKGLFDGWAESRKKHVGTPWSRLIAASRDLLTLRAEAAEGSDSALADFHASLANALGYEVLRETMPLVRNNADVGKVDVLAKVEISTGLHLVILEASLANDVDEVVSGVSADLKDGRLVSPMVTAEGSLDAPADAVAQLFAVDEPPRFVLIMAGGWVVLADRTKWAEGRFLAADFSIAAERNDRRPKGEVASLAALFSADALVPDGGQATIDELADNSHKHAVGVSKELRHGIRRSVEILANEVIEQRLAKNLGVYEGENAVDPNDLTRQCLRYLFRLLVLLYAEAHPELGILPVDDPAYGEGYGLDRLRELALVEMTEESTRTGIHVYESLQRLFSLTNEGNHVEGAQLAFVEELADGRSTEDYLMFPGLNSQLFGSEATPLLDAVPLRNEALQQVLQLLMITREKSGSDRGFISYAQLGINQIGAVYEGLMAYTGFFAREDLYEVAKKGDPDKGTWVLPVANADEYPDEVFVTELDPDNGHKDRLLHGKGSFVFRLSGRDRQRSASYYTPEVLTRCVVKHALAELLGTDDYAPEHGSSGIRPGEAHKILDLTICEPALGSGAFANEAVNQLSAQYLKRAQAERGETLDPDRYQFELQKIKAHFALHQTYGVDLNVTAVELAEVSLWLNAMYPGLRAPWFGVQLRRGNSLVGCRRATWTAEELFGDRKGPWAETRNGHVNPPTDRNLNDGPLGPDEIHHFLLPGHGWGAVANRTETTEARPIKAQRLRDWREKVLNAPTKDDARSLSAVAVAVEANWAAAAERIRLIQRSLRRPIDVYGVVDPGGSALASRELAEIALMDADSPLGRLRALMDAWVGLWFWPIDADVAPPDWSDWLAVAGELVRVEQYGRAMSQPDLFHDLQELLDAEERLAEGGLSVAELCDRHGWLPVALAAARREGAWHWELEYAPVFLRAGGFDLQVGNPPWVKPIWDEDSAVSEVAPLVGLGDDQANRIRHRAQQTASYVDELSQNAGLQVLSSPLLWPLQEGLQANLYQVFVELAGRLTSESGSIGFLHPDGHLTDAQSGALRSALYLRLRRLFRFRNELRLFEDIGNTRPFSVNIYGGVRAAPSFLQISQILHPDTADDSLLHDGTGLPPSQKTPTGEAWDLRGHARRVVRVEQDQIRTWGRATSSDPAKAMQPLLQSDQDALDVLGHYAPRSRRGLLWSTGLHERGAVKKRLMKRETRRPTSLAIVQGPHFLLATPGAQRPNPDCSSHRDYSALSLEDSRSSWPDRTNYQLVEGVDPVDVIDKWEGCRSDSFFRGFLRSMMQSSSERSLQPCLAQPGPYHVHAVNSFRYVDDRMTAALVGLWASIPVDYLAKTLGPASLGESFCATLPAPRVDSKLLDALLVRILRLNCLTPEYASLWEDLWNPAWAQDGWTDPGFHRLTLGEEQPNWSSATPLRRDFERRLALVELDALGALMLGLSAEQLCAMYRTQFAVLRKYEYKMVFDSEGRKICGYHQSAGYRQSQLQDQAKAGALPDEWKSIWKRYKKYEEDPESIDWMGHYTPPFYRPDREMEMTRAYTEFQRRLDDGEYD